MKTAAEILHKWFPDLKIGKERNSILEAMREYEIQSRLPCSLTESDIEKAAEESYNAAFDRGLTVPECVQRKLGVIEGARFAQSASGEEIAFAEWIKEEQWREWNSEKWFVYGNPEAGYKTTAELFKLYQQSKAKG